ncbi:MAG: NAD(P)/FAD-dependent oxidoreductase, partial [Frankiales bacterium]|nr:NAD(P)/FAD-dependent oxidoreductase [Frankiales bacterium]
PFSFWRDHMPAGMLLRSRLRSSHLCDPHAKFTLLAWAAAEGRTLATPLLLSDYLDYGRWFQRQAVPEVDRRRVQLVARGDGGFRVTLGDGERLEAERVVIAAGIQPFARVPQPFAGMAPALVSHTSEHASLDGFAGRRVAVVGAGQSALESAALLREAGAGVEVLARTHALRWLGPAPSDAPATAPRRATWPLAPTDIGGRVTSWVSAAPDVWGRVPQRMQPEVEYRCNRPAGAGWLRDRLADVPMTLGRTVRAAEPDRAGVRLRLDDDTERLVDHVLLATGYQIDVERYVFLDGDLGAHIHRADGYPLLGRGLESSVPGLNFLGAPAARSFGPVMRFVVGGWYAAPAVSAHIARGRRPRVWAFAPRRVVAASTKSDATRIQRTPNL